VFADPTSLLRCRYTCEYHWSVLFCNLLVIYLSESVIETKVVDLDSDNILYFVTNFFILIEF